MATGRSGTALPTVPDAAAAHSIGFYLPRSTFPAARGQLVCEAHRAGAPDDVVHLLRQLPPPPARFEDLQEVEDHLRAQSTGDSEKAVGHPTALREP